MKRILGWVVVVITTLFVAFNLERADVWFFGMRAQLPLALVVIAAALLGALATYAFSSLRRSK